MKATQEQKLAIRALNVRKTYGNAPALDGVSLEVAQGQMAALLGPSGSGKSTLLRCLSGLVRADAGGDTEIRIQGQVMQARGHVVPGARRIRSGVGFVFQQFNLVPRLKVITNVMVGRLARIPFWRRWLGWFTRAEKRAALEMLERVGIAAHAFKRASDLSGGQQQRAAIARGLMQEAKVILADEPIASLDPQSAHLVMRTLRDINRTFGVTVVVSLHQVDFALAYCERVVALKDGRVQFDGPTAECTPEVLREIYGDAVETMALEPGKLEGERRAKETQLNKIVREAEAL